MKYKASATINNNIDNVYDTILNIKEYPNFINMCKNIIILSKRNNIITSEVHVSYYNIKQKYITKIIHYRKDYIINIYMLSGPLRSLCSSWYLYKISNKTHVKFYIEFESQSKIINKLIDLYINTISDKILKSFMNKLIT